MFDTAGKPLFAALHAAALPRLGPAHDCVTALAEAAADPGPERTARAQAALDALPVDERDAIMAEAHARLRSDPAAWLALWKGGRPM